MAYRYFATPRRKFIIADTPGHEQYTRNMATGASTADLAVILVDAHQRRAAADAAARLYLFAAGDSASRGGNQQDGSGANIDEDVFARLARRIHVTRRAIGNFRAFCAFPSARWRATTWSTRSERMPWYQGPTLLEHLETVPIRPALAARRCAFPCST